MKKYLICWCFLDQGMEGIPALSNALLFYDAFRGLCRLRIDYAENKANKMLISAQLSAPDEVERLFQKEKFWLKVQDYWKGKLELSYKWEKDYFGRE